MDNPFARFSYARVTEAIRRQGAVPVAELSHSGLYANKWKNPPGIAYGPVETENCGRQILAMDEEMIARTISKFAGAAAFAKECGFGMVMIHAGHGWLLHQFLSPQLNTRKDKWGGADIENRSRLTVEVCKAVRKAVGPSFPVEIRISGSECYEGGYGIDEGVAYSKQFDGLVDLIHVSAGHHEVEEVYTITHPSLFLPDGANVHLAAEIRKHVNTPVATVGALADPELMEEIIADGRADVVELARGLFADPDLPGKARAGEKENIRPCMRCLACFSALVDKGEFYCAVNPENGREMELRADIPGARPKKVIVAGGGIAGMQAALTCAQRGHDVTLYEKEARLGGTLLCEENVPFKKLLSNYIHYQERQVRAAGVYVRLSEKLTPEKAQEAEADVIIASLGARPFKPPIPGIDNANVMSAEYAYVNPDTVGERPVILGAGLVGIELAIYLSMLGRKVTVIEMLPAINHGGNHMHARSLPVQIKKHDIRIHLNTKASEIGTEGVHCVDLTQPEGAGAQLIPADTVIYAVGQKSLTEEALKFNGSAPEFYQIGDCLSPKSIIAATSAAFEAARNIGRNS
jgi:2,4-dienoyl-CoA reductase-like NADH-dependent reductase (Old Yellow Enzyme family)/thioredoxin reductase